MAPGEQVQRREEGRGVWGWGRITGEQRTPALEGSSYLHRKGKVISLASFLPGLVMPPWSSLTSVNHLISFLFGEWFPVSPAPQWPFVSQQPPGLSNLVEWFWN